MNVLPVGVRECKTILAEGPAVDGFSVVFPHAGSACCLLYDGYSQVAHTANGMGQYTFHSLQIYPAHDGLYVFSSLCPIFHSVNYHR